MPIPCGSCAAPVHERAVTCPHCGLPTGTPPDRTLTTEERAAAVDLVRMQNDKYVPEEGGYSGSYVYAPDLAIVGAAVVVGAVVKSAVEAVVSEREERDSRPELPRAIARERTGPQPLVPDPSKEPEPPPPPSDTPRFLK